MSEAGQFTAQQAADPSTPGETLAAIAADRPDLRPALASNPATYPGLLEWLGNLGDPAVDEALRARSAPAAPTAVVPQAPPAEPSPAVPEPTAPVAPEVPPSGYQPPAAAGGYVPPATSVPPAGEWSTAAGGAYPPPGGQQPQAYGAPAPGYGPAPGGAYGTPPEGAYGPPPGSPYGPPQGGPGEPRNSRAWIWIVVAVVVLAVIGGGIYLVVRAVSNAADTIDEIVTSEDPMSYGDDSALDSLWDSCEGGDMEACDDLFRDSPVGSDYEDFGDTCGGRTDGGTWCADSGATDGQTSDEPTADQSTTSGAASAYGDDAALDALWDSCEGGDMGACDDLYRQSPVGSEYEDFGDTCGGRTDGGTWCDQ